MNAVEVALGGLFAAIFWVMFCGWLANSAQRRGPEAHARRRRLGSCLVPLPAAVMAGFFAIHSRGRSWDERVFISIVIPLSVAGLLFLFFWGRFLNPPSWKKEREKAASQRRWNLWAWIVTVGVVAVVLVANPPDRPGPNGNPNRPVAAPKTEPVSWRLVGALTVVPLLFYAMFVWKRLQLIKSPVNQAFRRANEGDLDGAIAELHHEVEMRGTSAELANGLGALYFLKKDYPTALAHWRKGLSIDASNLDLRLNFVLAMVRSGEAAEAEPLLAALVDEDIPDGYLSLAHRIHAEALIPLGRLDEAESELARAQQLLDGRTFFATKADKAAFRNEIENVRTRLVEARGAKSGVDLPEL